MLKGFFIALGELVFKVFAVFYIRKAGRDAEKLESAEKVIYNVQKANANADAYDEYIANGMYGDGEASRREPLVLRDNTSPPPERKG